MPLSLLFCHGWGFDAMAWDALAPLLPEFAQARNDAGYFGAPAAPRLQAPVLAVTHSFGTMRLLAVPPPGLVGLFAIAGFDRFTASRTFPGIAPRIVDRMISALAQEPDTVLADFHARLGSRVPVGAPDAERLGADLIVLRDHDLRGAIPDVPILSLQGACDPLLSVAMRETVFATASGVMRRTHPTAGHVPMRDDPSWCAEAIRAFAGTLA